MSMSTPSSCGSQQRGTDENTTSTTTSGSESRLLWALGGAALAGVGVAALFYLYQNECPKVTLVIEQLKEFIKEEFGRRKITDESCNICLEPLKSEELAERQQCMMLRCGHVFHQPCIDRWLQSREQQGECPTCPACRAPDPTNLLRLNIHPYCSGLQ